MRSEIGGHQFIYDHSTLRVALEKTGFVDIMNRAPGQSDDEILRGVEFHGRIIGNEELNAFETMVMEAIRA